MSINHPSPFFVVLVDLWIIIAKCLPFHLPNQPKRKTCCIQLDDLEGTGPFFQSHFLNLKTSYQPQTRRAPLPFLDRKNPWMGVEDMWSGHE